MMRIRLLALLAAVTSLLCACANPLLGPDDRKRICSVAVEEEFDAPAFHANAFSSPAGGWVGAGAGAIAGGSAGPFAIVTMPAGAVVGAIGGSACAAASLAHPSADADFERSLRSADVGGLKRMLERDLNAPRAGCRSVGASGAVPDAVLAIEKVDAGMGCLLGQQEFWVAVQWRTTERGTVRALNWTTTRCTMRSSRGIDDWFAHPDEARAELEQVFAATAHRMSEQWLSDAQLPRECTVQSGMTAPIEAR